jgi:hypothetical protein
MLLDTGAALDIHSEWRAIARRYRAGVPHPIARGNGPRSEQ